MRTYPLKGFVLQWEKNPVSSLRHTCPWAVSLRFWHVVLGFSAAPPQCSCPGHLLSWEHTPRLPISEPCHLLLHLFGKFFLSCSSWRLPFSSLRSSFRLPPQRGPPWDSHTSLPSLPVWLLSVTSPYCISFKELEHLLLFYLIFNP